MKVRGFGGPLGLLLVLTAALGFVAACAAPPAQKESSAGVRGYGRKGQPLSPGPGASGGSPTLEILKPKDGAIVKAGSVEVGIAVSNLKLVPFGGPRRKGQGHVHYRLDGVQAVSPSSFYVFEGVSRGSHTLEVELVQNDHSPLEPPVRQQVGLTAR